MYCIVLTRSHIPNKNCRLKKLIPESSKVYVYHYLYTLCTSTTFLHLARQKYCYLPTTRSSTPVTEVTNMWWPDYKGK